MELYHIKNIVLQKTTTKLKVFVCVKTFPSFLNYVSSISLDIALKVFSRQKEGLFFECKVSKFLFTSLFANARRFDVNKFRVERPRKTNLLTFLENKRLFTT